MPLRRRRLLPLPRSLVIASICCASAAVFFVWKALDPAQALGRPLPKVESHLVSRDVPVASLPVSVASPVPTPSPTPSPAPTPTSTPTPPAHTPPSSAHAPVAHILMYHCVRTVDPAKDQLGYNLSITPERLDQELAAMQAAGSHFITMAQLMAGGGGSRDVVLTFDDGYEDFYQAAFPILRKYGATATIYIITNKMGGQYMTWDQLRELRAAGIEIGAHTKDHPNLSSLSVASQREQIVGSKQALEQQLGGDPIVSFCYPSGRYNDDTVRLVREAGFTSATTTVSGSVDSLAQPLTLSRLRISPSLSTPTLLYELKN